MNCPYCNVPLMGGMKECPKCKYDIRAKDGGAKHKAWLKGRLATAEEVAEAEKEIAKEGENRKQAIESMILTTCPSVEGYHIVQQFGLVFGEVIYKTGLLKSLSASLDDIADIISFGDNELSGSAKMLGNAREYAMNKMKSSAYAKGANAIVGIDCESSAGNDILHITTYGTAVLLEKEL